MTTAWPRGGPARGERPLQGHCVEKLEHRPVPKLELVAAMATEPGGLPGRAPELERSAGDLARPAPRPRPPSRD